MRADLASILRERRGHFELESGLHGRRWLDLELLFLRPAAVRPLAAELAGKLTVHRPELVCSPLVEGAFVGMLVAEALDAPFTYAQRLRDERGVRYELPRPFEPIVRGRRVAIVNDVIHAGSAVRGTLVDLAARRAKPVAIGALLALSTAPEELARKQELPLETLDAEPDQTWRAGDCPLCAAGAPLEPHPGW